MDYKRYESRMRNPEGKRESAREIQPHRIQQWGAGEEAKNVIMPMYDNLQDKKIIIL